MIHRVTITETSEPFEGRPTIRIDFDSEEAQASRRRTIYPLMRAEHDVFLDEKGERVRVSKQDATELRRVAALLSALASEVTV